MSKKKVLFIGHMYPEEGQKSEKNYDFCKRLVGEGGMEIFLLSDAWNKISDGVSSVSDKFEELLEAKVFKEKYYVDPIQTSNSDMGILALYYKIKRKHTFDLVIISDIQDYLMYLSANLNSGL